MATMSAIPLRFQKQELQQRAALSEAGLSCLTMITGPQEMIATLTQMGEHRDAIAALALMLPRRQAVWWACLVARLIPDLAKRPEEQVAVEAAEAWVQGQRAEESERALNAAEMCPMDAAATYVAMAAYWCGPSLAPRGQQPVPPPPYLPGVAVRAVMTLTLIDPVMIGRVEPVDLLGIGTALMHGDLGRNAQTAIRDRLATGG